MGILDAFSTSSPRDIAYVQELLANRLIDQTTVKEWMYGRAAATATVAVETKLPEHCSECNHHNPYVGKEHMVPGNPGDAYQYVCRQCRPKYDRQQSIAKLKLEEAAREARKTDYSGGANPPYQGPAVFKPDIWDPVKGGYSTWDYVKGAYVGP